MSNRPVYYIVESRDSTLVKIIKAFALFVGIHAIPVHFLLFPLVSIICYGSVLALCYKQKSLNLFWKLLRYSAIPCFFLLISGFYHQHI